MRTKSLFSRILEVCVIAALFALVLPAPAEAKEARAALIGLEAFIASVQNGQADTLRGAYVPNVMAYPVVQQPEDNSAFVSSQPGTLTEFNMARRMGGVGLLAHNTLAGQAFFNIQRGHQIILVYGAGRTETFVVERILAYQALPDGTYKNLETGETVGVGSLFFAAYGGSRHLTLQTCIAAEGNNEWGRLFIIAQPLAQAEEAASSGNE